MNYRHYLAAFLATGIMLISCNKQPDDPAPAFSGDIYVLNNGNWGSNDSGISVYNLDTKELAADAFYNANDIALGDLGQDIMIDGKNIYIAVYGSKCIFVTDKALNVKKTLEISSEDGTRLSPRTLCKANDRIYVTMYEGFVAEINPADNYSVRLTPVGSNPEGIAYAKGKLYVANSGGMNFPNYDNTVSVIDASSFKETSRITVNVNPSSVAANSDGSLVFVSSYGDYGMTPGKLQAISTSSSTVSDLGYENISGFSMGADDRLYILTAGYDDNWNPLAGTVYVQDARSTVASNVKFVTDGTELDEAYSISATSDGYIYIGISDYKTNGDICVFNQNGKLYDRFDTAGLNPQKVVR